MVIVLFASKQLHGDSLCELLLKVLEAYYGRGREIVQKLRPKVQKTMP